MIRITYDCIDIIRSATLYLVNTWSEMERRKTRMPFGNLPLNFFDSLINIVVVKFKFSASIIPPPLYVLQLFYALHSSSLANLQSILIAPVNHKWISVASCCFCDRDKNADHSNIDGHFITIFIPQVHKVALDSPSGTSQFNHSPP